MRMQTNATAILRKRIAAAPIATRITTQRIIEAYSELERVRFAYGVRLAFNSAMMSPDYAA